MLNPISTITVESALIPSTSEPEVAADLFQTLIAELLEPTQPVPPESEPSVERVFFSPPGQEAWPRPQENAAKHPLIAADGVVDQATAGAPAPRRSRQIGDTGAIPPKGIRLDALTTQIASADNRWLETTTPSAPDKDASQHFSLWAQPPLLREGGESTSPQRDATPKREAPKEAKSSPLPTFVTFMPQQILPQPQIVPEATQLVTDAPIILPLVEVTSIKIETEALPAPTAHLKLDPTPVQSEPVPNPPTQVMPNEVLAAHIGRLVRDSQATIVKPEVQTPQTHQTAVQPEVTTRQPVQAQPITIAPESLIKVSAATGNTPQFAQSGSQEKQDFRNENGRAPIVETRSITPQMENPVRFQAHLPMESAPVAHVVEQPPQLPLPVAHRVSIDIGEKDSRVVVTLHENRGDISVKIHAPNQVLGAELRTSAATLVEAFHREHIPLANMDFTSGYTATSDDRQQHGSQPRQSFHNRGRKFESATAPTDHVEITSINLNA